jgi:hypothetical protein
MKKIFIVLVICIIGFFVLASCDIAPDSYQKNTEAREKTMQNVTAAVPAPVLITAQERKMVAKRATRFDVENKLGYVYIFTDTGGIIGYYTILGKVASLRSYLTPVEQVLYPSSEGRITVEAPDIDGTYGENVDGVFFFTDNDIYVEWNGKYLYSEEPVPIQVPKLNVKTVK